MTSNLLKLEKAIGYTFNDPKLLRQALSHRSIDGDNNERLEFLGDSVLGLVITNYLYCNLKSIDEGELSKLRSNIVCGKTLATVASNLNLGSYLFLGVGEKKSGGHLRESILGDALEALIGAIFLDANLNQAEDCIIEWFKSSIEKALLKDSNKDAKTSLQEWLQKRGHSLPVYKLVASHGDPHSKTFTIECTLEQFKLTASDCGLSRKAAEQLVASKLLSSLKNID